MRLSLIEIGGDVAVLAFSNFVRMILVEIGGDVAVLAF